MNENQELNQQVVAESSPKKSNNKLILIVVALVLVIGVVLFLVFGTDLFKGEEKKEETKEEPKKEEVVSVNPSGVYENNGVTVKVFYFEKAENSKYRKDTVEFNIDSDGNGFGSYGDYENDKVTGSVFESEVTLTFKNNELELNGNESFVNENPDMTVGVYKKVKDYTADDYYSDNIGDINYLNSSYNGKYELDGNVLYAYQTESDTVTIVLISASENYFGYFGRSYKINEDGTLIEDYLSEGEEPTSSISFDGEQVVFNYTEDEGLSGTYTKKSSLSVKDIINLN